MADKTFKDFVPGLTSRAATAVTTADKIPIVPNAGNTMYISALELLNLANRAYLTIYGIKGDGVTDDTTAIQTALTALAGSGRPLLLPAGQYLVTAPITIPANGSIIGSWESAPKWGGSYRPGAGAWTVTNPTNGGTTIKTNYGNGDDTVTPLITMKENTTLRGVSFYHPNQAAITAAAPVLFPYVVKIDGNDCTIRDCNFANSYKAIIARNSNRIIIESCLFQTIKTSIDVSESWDTSRITNCQHVPPYVYDVVDNAYPAGVPATNLQDWIKANKQTILLSGCDAIYLENCFDFMHLTGITIQNAASGHEVWGMANNCGWDASAFSTEIYATNSSFGFAFNNCEFSTRATGDGYNIVARLYAGAGLVSFNGCRFTNMEAALYSEWAGAVNITGCHINGNTTLTVPFLVFLGGYNNVVGNVFHNDKNQMDGSGASVGSLLCVGNTFLVGGLKVLVAPRSGTFFVVANNAY